MSEPERLRAAGPAHGVNGVNGVNGQKHSPSTVEIPVTVVRAKRREPAPAEGWPVISGSPAQTAADAQNQAQNQGPNHAPGYAQNRARNLAEDIAQELANDFARDPFPLPPARVGQFGLPAGFPGSAGAPAGAPDPMPRPDAGYGPDQRYEPGPSAATAQEPWWRAPIAAAAAVLLLLSVGAGLGALYHLTKAPQATATIGILITASTASLTDPNADTAPEQRDVTTRVDLLGSPLVEDRAERALGRPLPHLQITSRTDSDIIQAEVAAANRTDAANAVTAYVSAYEQLLAAQQKVSLTGEKDRLDTLYAGYQKQVAALDKQLDGASTLRRQILLTSQAPRRTTFATSMDDASTRLSRVDELLDSLPVTTKRLDTTPVTKIVQASAVTDIGTGVALGVLASGVLLYRRFRPRFA